MGDLFTVKHGYAFKGEYFGTAGEHVLLTPGNFRASGGLQLKGDKEKFYSGEIPEEYLLRRGDLLVAMTDLTQEAPILGSPAFIPEDGRFLHNQRLGKIVDVRADRVIPEFLFYLFDTAEVRGQIKGTASGATVRHTSPSRIADVRVAIPSVPAQRRIAAALSAYDDLIENNLRRIRILEEMARSLFREWFIELRFPGSQGGDGTVADACPTPPDWVRTTVGAAFTTVLGGTPSRSRPEYWQNGTVAWINSGKVNELRVIEPSEYITPLALERSAAKLMPRGTTVLAITGATLGQVSFLEIETAANQSVVGITDETSLHSEWIYLTIKERIEEIIMHASGGAQQHINKEIVQAVELTIPPPAIASSFKAIVSPMFGLLATLLLQTRNLRCTRDLLLPRLISGQVGLGEAAA